MVRIKLSLAVAFTVNLLLIYSCRNSDKKHGDDNIKNSLSQGETGKKYQYSLHPVTGKKYYYTITTETKTKLEVNDKEVETGNEIKVGLVYEVIKDSAGIMVLKLTYNKLHFEIKKNEEETKVFDADTPPGEQTTIENLLSIIKGNPVFLTLNTKGDILSTNGNKEVSDKVMAVLTTEEPSMKQLVQQLLNKLTGDSFIQDNIREGFKLFPDSSVYIGASWNRNASQSAEINFETAAKYTLASVDDNIAIIEVDGQINSAKNNTSSIMGRQVTTDLNGEQTGKFKTDITTGLLQSGKSTTSIKGTIKVLEKEVPISIKIKKEITLQE